MVHKLLFGSAASTPSSNNSKHPTRSRFKASWIMSKRPYLSRPSPGPVPDTATTYRFIKSNDQTSTSSTMTPGPSNNEDEVNDPSMADSWSPGPDAQLNREYTLIDGDQTKEQDYEVIPNPKTKMVEKNPQKPLLPIDHYAKDRSYTRELATRMGYWSSDPISRLNAVKYDGTYDRPWRIDVAQQRVEHKAWVDKINSDIQILWNDMGKDQGLSSDELHKRKADFFRKCRIKLEAIEEASQAPEHEKVTLSEFQEVVRTCLVAQDLKLAVDGLVIMKGMATELRQTKPS